jgi:hypothetical protein
MKSTMLLRVSPLLLLITCVAQAQDIRLNLTNSDELMMRRMTVYKTSGETLKHLVKVRSYDPQSASFVMEDVTGGTITIAVSDLSKIDFEQSLSDANPVVQSPMPKIIATPGPKVKYTVPQDALKVDVGDLLFPASSPSTTTPGPPPPPVLPGVATVDSKNIHRVTQPRSLTFDKPHKCFYVEVENFTYLVEPPSGSSRPSGVVK